MIPEDIDKLQRSWRELTGRGDTLVARFYDELFQRRPHTREIFKHVSLAEQRRKLMYALSFAVRNLQKPDILTVYLEGLGGAHVGYGVQMADYPEMVECIVLALRNAGDVTWTEEIERLWREALTIIVETMIAGATKPPLVCSGPVLPKA